MNKNYATDTMALVLRLEKRRMSRQIKSIFERVETGNALLIIPAMVLAEIGYLAEKKRIDTNLNETTSYCESFPSIQIEALSSAIIQSSFEIDDIPELHDRLIAGTARNKGVDLISNDNMISQSKFVSTLW